MMGGANAKALRDMQNRLAKMQEELAAATVEATAGGGAVKVVMTGQQQVQAVTIDPAAVDPDDVEMLQDLIVAAVNEALGKSQQLAAGQMSKLTGGMKIPGLF
jgi:nucleoid-associated protein EbfC